MILFRVFEILNFLGFADFFAATDVVVNLTEGNLGFIVGDAAGDSTERDSHAIKLYVHRRRHREQGMDDGHGPRGPAPAAHQAGMGARSQGKPVTDGLV